MRQIRQYKNGVPLIKLKPCIEIIKVLIVLIKIPNLGLTPNYNDNV